MDWIKLKKGSVINIEVTHNKFRSYTKLLSINIYSGHSSDPIRHITNLDYMIGSYFKAILRETKNDELHS